VTYALLFLLAVGVVWWWTSRVAVTLDRVPEVSARIQFPTSLRLNDPALAVSQLERPDEIVIPHQYATLVLVFPLTTPATLAITAPIEHGFTRADLVRTICDEYENIYDIEEATAQTKPIPESESAKLGRNRTDGLYGIWGHDRGDLVMTAVHWTRSPDSRITIRPHVEARPRPELPQSA
jgi:hypothetical protein